MLKHPPRRKRRGRLMRIRRYRELKSMYRPRWRP